MPGVDKTNFNAGQKQIQAISLFVMLETHRRQTAFNFTDDKSDDKLIQSLYL